MFNFQNIVSNFLERSIFAINICIHIIDIYRYIAMYISIYVHIYCVRCVLYVLIYIYI